MAFPTQAAQTRPSTYAASSVPLLTRYPLVTFFAMAFAGAWLAFLPLLLAQNGLGLLPFKLPLTPFLALATFTGPALSAVTMASLLGGKAAVRALLRRYSIWRFNPIWYVVIVFVPPVMLLLGSVVSLGIAPLQTFLEQALPFVSTYPLLMLVGLVTGPLGEELGWRGFALPRLQERVGPLSANLILGTLWAAWHLPLFFIPEWAGSIEPATLLLAYFCWVIPFAVVITWVFNHTQGSLLSATLLHAALNAAIGLIPLGILIVPNDLFLQAKVYGPLAILLIILTRGRLGYNADTNAVAPAPFTTVASTTAASPSSLPVSTPASAVTPSTRGSLLRKVAIGLVVFLVLAWGVANVAYTLINGSY